MPEFAATIRDLIRPYCLATLQLSPEDLDKDLETKYRIESDIKSKPEELKNCHETVRKRIGVGDDTGVSTSTYYATLCQLLRTGKIEVKDFIDNEKFDELKRDKSGEEKAISHLAWCIIKLYGDWFKPEPQLPP